MENIFINSGNENDVACFATKPEMSFQFYDYIVAYFYAADKLIEEEILNSTNESDNKEDSKRECAIVSCFLYRHYLELALKQIYLLYTNDNETQKEVTLKDVNHHLKKIWKHVKPLLQIVTISQDKINMLDSYITEFSNKDPNSFTFRYPITKKLLSVYPENIKINLKHLQKQMMNIESFFCSFLTSLDLKKRNDDANAFFNLGQESFTNKDYSSSIKNYKKAIELKETYSSSHPDLIIGYLEISLPYNCLDDHENALSYLFKAKELHELLTKENKAIQIPISYILVQIGKNYIGQKKEDIAVDYLLEALKDSSISSLDKQYANRILAHWDKNAPS